ncbi:MAG: hypothetical protein J2P25_07755 [Nocardiopsaceae bacterium]|nr:hypothetical protein [Nocardiopsaceae bacterium]
MTTEPGSDPIGDFQRWLMKAGARGLSRDVTGRLRSTLGGRPPGDVWETATTEQPGDEPPECQWCPVCRAARRYRDSGGAGGLGPSLAAAGDTLAGLAQDAFGLFEAAMRAQQQRPEGRDADPPAPAGTSSDDGTVVGPGVAWPTVVHPEHEHGEASDERGDAAEDGQSGDGPAGNGSDQ